MSVIITIVIVSTTTSLVSLHCTASPNNHVAYCSSTISQRTFRLLRLTHIQISVRGTICYPVPVHLLITLCVCCMCTRTYQQVIIDVVVFFGIHSIHPRIMLPSIPPPSQSVRSLIKCGLCGYFCPCPRDTQNIQARDCCQKCRIWGVGKGGEDTLQWTHNPGDPHRQSLNRASQYERWARRVSASPASCSAATDCACHGACRIQSVRCPTSDSHCCPGHCLRPSHDHWVAPPYGN